MSFEEALALLGLPEPAVVEGATDGPDGVFELSAPSAAPNPLQAYRERVWTVEDYDERLAVAREAVQQMGSAGSYHLLLDVLEEYGTADEAAIVETLREAIERGHGGDFLSMLGRRFPDALTSDELERWGQQAADHDWPAVAIALARRGLSAGAVSLALSRLGSMASNTGIHRVSSYEIITLALELAARGQVERAGEVFRAADAVYGLGDVKTKHGDALRTAMVRELVRVAPRLPEQVPTAIAGGLLRHDPSHTDAELLLVNLRKGEARNAAELLKREAPLLFECHGKALQGQGPDTPSAWRQSVPRFSWTWFILASVAVRALVPLLSHDCGVQAPPGSSPYAEQERPRAGKWEAVFCRGSDAPLCGPVLRYRDAASCDGMVNALRDIEAARADLAARGELLEFQEQAIVRIREHTLKTCPMEASWSRDPP